MTDQDKLDAVRREIKYRKRVYPRLIDQGKITASFAADQIAIFEAIAEDYHDKVMAGDLFEGK